MQIFTVSTKQKDEALAIAEIKELLQKKSSEEPDFIQFYFSHGLDPEKLRLACLERFEKSKFTGCTTQAGAFDKDNVLGFEDSAKANSSRFSVRSLSKEPEAEGVYAMAFYDPKGSFGNAVCSFKGESDLNVSAKINECASCAGRAGVMPNLIIMHNTKAAISIFKTPFQAVLGLATAMIGGLMYTNEKIEAKVFTQKEALVGFNLYVMSFLYTQCDISIESHSPCESTGLKARVTRFNSNILEEINNQPAADLIFRWIGIDSTTMSIEQMNDSLEKIQIKNFVAKAENVITSDIKYNVSMMVKVTPNRGILTNYFWSMNDIVHLMRADNNDLSDSFIAHKLKPSTRIIAQLHIMCESFCAGENARYFKSFVVDRVRSIHHTSSEFLAFSAAGELGKGISDNLILGNYTVSTVSFIDTTELAKHE